MSEAMQGPFWEGRNWSADAGAGSIHDDDTAAKLGFRGGTVAGDVHMNQFPPVLLRIFGEEWLRSGNLSLIFKNATVDRERVQVSAEPLATGATQTRVWMERDDGLLVATGTAAVGDHDTSELRARDLRPGDPAQLKILNRIATGMSLGHYELTMAPDKQFDRYDKGLISDALPIFRSNERYGEPVAAPCTYVEYLWGPPMAGLRPHTGEAVGLFGAIEIGNVAGPFLLNRPYHVDSSVVCVGESPKTEYLWFDTTARTPEGDLVATFRMMLRFMKASSPLYR
jgi:hypothetical protein